MSAIEILGAPSRPGWLCYAVQTDKEGRRRFLYMTRPRPDNAKSPAEMPENESSIPSPPPAVRRGVQGNLI